MPAVRKAKAKSQAARQSGDWRSRASSVLAGGADLEEPDQQDGQAGQDAVVDEWLQGTRLQIVEEEGDYQEADDGGDRDAPKDGGHGHIELAGALHFQQLGDFLGSGSGD